MREFFRHHRDRAIAYLLTIRRARERKLIMGILKDIADLKAHAKATDDQIAGLLHPTTGVASQSDLKALDDRLTADELLLGDADERAAAAAPAAPQGDQSSTGQDPASTSEAPVDPNAPAA